MEQQYLIHDLDKRTKILKVLKLPWFCSITPYWFKSSQPLKITSLICSEISKTSNYPEYLTFN